MAKDQNCAIVERLAGRERLEAEARETKAFLRVREPKRRRPFKPVQLAG